MLTKHLFRRVDIAPIIFFRTVVGSLIALELMGEWLSDYNADFFNSTFNYSYQLTPWLKPWSPSLMHLHFALNALLAIMVTIGLYYRISAALLFLGTTTAFLMEQSVYINHTYLYCLLALLMVFIPANRAWSLDVSRGAVPAQVSAPAWAIYLLQFQIGIVYIFAGIAKLNPDWLAGSPLNIWLPARQHYYLIGPLLAQQWLPQFMSWGGAALDLLVVPALLWRRTRPYAFGVACLFHITNVSIFGIGTFPWLSIAMSALFFTPSAFRQLPILRKKIPRFTLPGVSKLVPYKKLTLVLLGLYVLFQIGVPLRQFAYASNSSYTEDGHNFSWHMMLRDKRGSISFRVSDQFGTLHEQVDLGNYLSLRQQRRVVGKPDMILALAHFIRKTYEAKGYQNVAVYASCQVSLNGRPYQEFIKQGVDLGREPRHLASYNWVMPLAHD